MVLWVEYWFIAAHTSFVHLLICWKGVLVKFISGTISHNTECFWLSESLVHQSLIVMDKIGLSFESLTPVILALRENIIFLRFISNIRLCSFRIIVYLRIASKSIVECSFVLGWLIHRLETSTAIWDIGVSTTTVIGVANWFWVYLG